MENEESKFKFHHIASFISISYIGRSCLLYNLYTSIPLYLVYRVTGGLAVIPEGLGHKVVPTDRLCTPSYAYSHTMGNFRQLA